MIYIYIYIYIYRERERERVRGLFGATCVGSSGASQGPITVCAQTTKPLKIDFQELFPQNPTFWESRRLSTQTQKTCNFLQFHAHKTPSKVFLHQYHDVGSLIHQRPERSRFSLVLHRLLCKIPLVAHCNIKLIR